jgi:hypothetical protein
MGEGVSTWDAACATTLPGAVCVRVVPDRRDAPGVRLAAGDGMKLAVKVSIVEAA